MINRRAAGAFSPLMAAAFLIVLPALTGWRVAPAQQPATCGPSPVGATCGGSGPASLGNTGGVNQGAGNPINLLTGNKYQRESDMSAMPGTLGVEIVRHYNSLDRSPGSFGVGWRLSYDTQLSALGNSIQISEADGHRIMFKRPGSRGGMCVGEDPSQGTLEVRRSTRGDRYLWTWPNGRVLSFDASGKLQEIADGRGGLLTLTRGLNGELLAVTDPLGRQLTLQYEPQGRRITAIRSPLGVFNYGYDPHGADPKTSGMSAVTMSDGHTVRRYHYERRFQAGDPNALTGISVQFKSDGTQSGLSMRLSTYGYDPGGRAIWSMRGDGLERVAIGRSSGSGTRTHPATAVLVNARGEKTRHVFAVMGGQYRLLSSAGPGCVRCGPGGVRYEYDDFGRLIAKIESGSSETPPPRTEYEYDARGRLIRVRAPSVIPGKWHTTEYVFSKETSTEDPVARIETGYSSAGEIRRRTDFSFDARGRLIREGSTRIEYDSLGRIASRRDARGAADRYEYDTLSRPSRVTLADGRVVKYGYDSRGRICSIGIDGRVEQYEYDAADRLSRVVRPNGEVLNYRYDAADRVTAITDARGNRIIFGRDQEGELLWREFHDSNGDLLQRREDHLAAASELDRAIGVDAGGRPTSFRGANGADGAYEYDDFGRLTAIYSSQGGWTRFEYDVEDRLTAKTLPNATRIAYQVDLAGGHIAMVTPEGTTTLRTGTNRRPESIDYPGGYESFEYDPAARLIGHTRHVDGKAFATRYRYSQKGQLLEKQLPGGQTLIFTYGRAPSRSAGLLESIELISRGRRTELLSGLNSADDTLNRRSFKLLGRAQFQREIDSNGHLRRIGADGYWQQSFGPASAVDPHGRAVTPAGVAPRQVRDAVGNVVNDGRHEFEWDSQSRLVGVLEHGRRIASYAYDAAGMRISKKVYGPDGEVTTHFLYEQGRLIAEIDFRGNVSKQYVWLDDQPIAVIDGERVVGLIADQTFAPRAAFDKSQGYQVDRLTNLRGSHQYFDAETGLLYNGRRYLDPSTGSYLSADPLGVAGGPDAFAFAAGDLGRYVDLHGLQAQPVTVQDASLGDWSLQQKLAFVFEDAARQIQDHELAAALRELVSPAALATTAVIFSTWAASQFTPYGWVSDVALTGIGALFLGKSIWDVIETTYQVGRGLTFARCESDLHDASVLLARGLSQAAASLAAAGATGAAVGAARIARLLRTVFRRDLPQVRRSASLAAVNQQRFGLFNPARGAYSGRSANQEWSALQRANHRSDAHPPWDPAKSVVDTWLNPGDTVYLITVRGFSPGGWGTSKQYSSLDEARKELAILEQFKRGDLDLVIQEYKVAAPLPVREGYAGPQVSGWPASESYVGGGPQLQFLVDMSGTKWKQFMSLEQVIELKK